MQTLNRKVLLILGTISNSGPATRKYIFHFVHFQPLTYTFCKRGLKSLNYYLTKYTSPFGYGSLHTAALHLSFCCTLLSALPEKKLFGSS